MFLQLALVVYVDWLDHFESDQGFESRHIRHSGWHLALPILSTLNEVLTQAGSFTRKFSSADPLLQGNCSIMRFAVFENLNVEEKSQPNSVIRIHDLFLFTRHVHHRWCGVTASTTRLKMISLLLFRQEAPGASVGKPASSDGETGSTSPSRIQ